MTTLVFGNSHAIALGAANRARPPALAATREVHCAHSELRVEAVGDTRIIHAVATPARGEVPATRLRIDLRDYDGLVIAACGWTAPRSAFLEAPRPVHPLGYMACAGWGHDPRVMPPGVRLVSRAVFRVTVEAWLRRHPMTQLALDLAPFFARPVIIQPWPAPSLAERDNPRWTLNRWYRQNGPAVWREYFAAQTDALRRIFGEPPGRFILLDYPVPGAGAEGFMGAAWCARDPFHANARYGELVLRQIDAALDGLAPSGGEAPATAGAALASA